MSLLNSVLKVFVGDKSKQDVKALMPVVNKIKTFQAATQALSNDALRAKTQGFKTTIKDACQTLENSISELYTEADTTEDIDRKEEIYQEIDSLKDDVYVKTQEVLETILPEAFSVIKETARRFVNNTTIEVTASTYDRELSGTKDYISLDGEKAFWANSWDAAGKPITWDMVHYDVQLDWWGCYARRKNCRDAYRGRKNIGGDTSCILKCLNWKGGSLGNGE